MQPFRIRSNDTTTQGFTHAELDFAFHCSPPPGFSDICYPKLKLSTNEAQLVAFLPKLQNPPNTPQEPLILREVGLRASTIIIPKRPTTENHPAARVLSLSSGIMEL